MKFFSFSFKLRRQHSPTNTKTSESRSLSTFFSATYPSQDGAISAETNETEEDQQPFFYQLDKVNNGRNSIIAPSDATHDPSFSEVVREFPVWAIPSGSPESAIAISNQHAVEIDKMMVEAIACHEAGKLERATELFYSAASFGSPIGLLLYGLSLRHGWGCGSNQTLAFQCLQWAAEYAVIDLTRFTSSQTQRNASTASLTAAYTQELTLAIFELGICFRYGWGVPKNKTTAVYYFEIAAFLDDPDAQLELAFCYHHGIGVKHDRYLAAKFYRMAHVQGVTVPGNSWIFKEKYVKH